MNQQYYDDIPNAPAQRVIEDVMFALRSLKTPEKGNPCFNNVIPTTTYSFVEGCEVSMPVALVYFGEEADGWNSASDLEEPYLFPNIEICFLLYIPNEADGSYPDVQKMQMALHEYVVLNLRVPTLDLTTGIVYQKNATTGKLLWDFQTPEGAAWKPVTRHKFDVRNKWIESGRSVPDPFYISSLTIGVRVCNFNAE